MNPHGNKEVDQHPNRQFDLSSATPLPLSQKLIRLGKEAFEQTADRLQAAFTFPTKAAAEYFAPIAEAQDSGLLVAEINRLKRDQRPGYKKIYT